MPLLEKSPFFPPFFLKNPDVQTILCHLVHKPVTPSYTRERIHTPDHDFLDLDWTRSGHHRLAILSHGLEGSSNSRYIMSMTDILSKNNWDVLAWNMRGCSGEPNLLENSYHSGKWEDLETVIEHAAPKYEGVVLIGFSIGGNITLHYLGSRASGVPRNVRSAVAISVPCDLRGSAEKMGSFRNKIYMSWFISLLREKLIAKKRFACGSPEAKNFKKLKNFLDYDSAYTARDNGFRDAYDYWERASSLFVLDKISIPTLLLNAKDDSFLSPHCYPNEIARKSEFLHLEIPEYGGHVGFWEGQRRGVLWSEARSMEFISKTM